MLCKFFFYLFSLSALLLFLSLARALCHVARRVDDAVHCGGAPLALEPLRVRYIVAPVCQGLADKVVVPAQAPPVPASLLLRPPAPPSPPPPPPPLPPPPPATPLVEPTPAQFVKPELGRQDPVEDLACLLAEVSLTRRLRSCLKVESTNTSTIKKSVHFHTLPNRLNVDVVAYREYTVAHDRPFVPTDKNLGSVPDVPGIRHLRLNKDSSIDLIKSLGVYYPPSR